MLLLARTARALRAPLTRRPALTTRQAGTTTEPLYVTTPIYYVNAAPHVGHAYTSVACDAAARFARLDGREATLVTGTDEHGEKVEESAAAKGVEPLEFATSVSNTFRELADSFDIKYDRFIRTTDDDHKVAVEALWKRLEDAGQIYLGSYEGWYCVRDECYYTEGELVDGKAPTGADVEWRAKEPSYFFKLSDWGDKLIELYEKEDILGPKSRKNEVLSFLKMEELRDLSISRTSFKWGLQVPGDPDHVARFRVGSHFDLVFIRSRRRDAVGAVESRCRDRRDVVDANTRKLRCYVFVEGGSRRCLRRRSTSGSTRSRTTSRLSASPTAMIGSQLGPARRTWSARTFYASTLFTGRPCSWRRASRPRRRYTLTAGGQKTGRKLASRWETLLCHRN